MTKQQLCDLLNKSFEDINKDRLNLHKYKFITSTARIVLCFSWQFNELFFKQLLSVIPNNYTFRIDYDEDFNELVCMIHAKST